MVYELVISLPYSHKLRNMQGVHLVRDGGLSNDTYKVELDKVIVDSWTYTEHSSHECIGNGDCRRCSNNLDMEVEHLELSPMRSKTKLVYERKCGHTIGSVFTDWAQID